MDYRTLFSMPDEDLETHSAWHEAMSAIIQVHRNGGDHYTCRKRHMTAACKDFLREYGFSVRDNGAVTTVSWEVY